jgi:hypothetical protein
VRPPVSSWAASAAEVFRTPDDRIVFCEIAARPGGGICTVVTDYAHKFVVSAANPEEFQRRYDNLSEVVAAHGWRAA